MERGTAHSSHPHNHPEDVRQEAVSRTEPEMNKDLRSQWPDKRTAAEMRKTEPDQKEA
jgi:hypothetical protein